MDANLLIKHKEKQDTSIQKAHEGSNIYTSDADILNIYQLYFGK